MSHPICTWAVVIAAAAAVGLAGRAAHATPAVGPKLICDKHLHHCHPPAATTSFKHFKQVCRPAESPLCWRRKAPTPPARQS